MLKLGLLLSESGRFLLVVLEVVLDGADGLLDGHELALDVGRVRGRAGLMADARISLVKGIVIRCMMATG